MQMRGRGTPDNPANRYDRLHVELTPEEEGSRGPVPTQFFRDDSRSILSENDSPDLDFRWSLNPYRGCEHGCVYCYARPTHEYLGFSAGLDFETRILVKEDAPALLRAALMRPSWRPELISLSGNTDPYQPAERSFRVTRGCLEVLQEFRNPTGIVTKSALVVRDADLLADLAGHGAARVWMSITSLDPELSARLEPRAARPARRLEALAELSAAGVPAGVLVAPVIPGLTDHEIPAILEAAAGAGARAASWILLRLPSPLEELFGGWLQEHYPQARHKVLGRIRECRDGRISDGRFGARMRGRGPYAEHLGTLFQAAARRHGLQRRLPEPRTAAFRSRGQQGLLFDP